MDGIKLGGQSVSVGNLFMLNGVEFIDLRLIITMMQDLCAL